MKAKLEKILGHNELRSHLIALAQRGLLAHSNLLVGPRGIGKKLVAREIGKFLLCEKRGCSSAASQAELACNNCQACHLFESGNHPDFYQLECESEGLSAEQAREFLHSVYLAPYRGRNRVIIFNDADSLSTVVANLLLKTLEEPRNDIFFFLIAANASRLPLPIVSRCQTWRFSRLLDDEVREALCNVENRALVDDLIELADGSLEHINDLSSFIPLWESTKNKMEKILAGESYLAMNYAAELSKNKDQISANLALIRLYLNSKLRMEEHARKQLILADGLENILVAERLILERNLSPLSVLNLCFLGLSGKVPAKSRLIGEIVI